MYYALFYLTCGADLKLILKWIFFFKSRDPLHLKKIKVNYYS